MSGKMTVSSAGDRVSVLIHQPRFMSIIPITPTTPHLPLTLLCASTASCSHPFYLHHPMHPHSSKHTLPPFVITTTHFSPCCAPSPPLLNPPHPPSPPHPVMRFNCLLQPLWRRVRFPLVPLRPVNARHGRHLAALVLQRGSLLAHSGDAVGATAS